MKKFNLIFILLLIFGNANSQYVIKVSDTFENYGTIGNKKSITVNIFDRNAETIKKEWARLMSVTYFSDKANWKTESFIDNVSIKLISPNTVDIYGMVKYSTDGAVTFSTATDMGGTFMNETDHKLSYQAMKKIMYDFAVDQSKQGLAEKIKDQQKLLDVFKEDEVAITAEISGYQQEVIGYQNKIAELQNNIKLKEEAKLNKQKKIQEQQNLLIKTMQITVQ
jgi:hypothetical protein